MIELGPVKVSVSMRRPELPHQTVIRIVGALADYPDVNRPYGINQHQHIPGQGAASFKLAVVGPTQVGLNFDSGWRKTWRASKLAQHGLLEQFWEARWTGRVSCSHQNGGGFRAHTASLSQHCARCNSASAGEAASVGNYWLLRWIM